jgi:hypothetical protein
MNIFISDGTKQEGPYTADQIETMRQQGSVTDRTLAWAEGAPNWLPLNQILQPLGKVIPPPVPSPTRTHGLGLASFWIGIAGIPFWLVLLAVAGVASARGASDQSPVMIIVGLVLMAGVAVNVAGAIFGIVAGLKPDFKGTLSIIGAALNGFQGVGIVGLTILGMMTR